jgi:adenosylcobinamide-GDP ribazoletransferase
MLQFIRHYLLAVQFFTRLPVTGKLADWVGFSPAMLRASAAHFPGVGWLVGALVAGFTWTLLHLLPASPYAPLVAAVLGTVLSVLITGAFHEDGLADLADGLGGTQNRERALEIMKDSRVGAFGAIAMALVLLTKVALLALLGSLPSADSYLLLCIAIFAAHVVSRTWPLIIIRLLPHVGDTETSKAKPLADQISLVSLGVAFLWCFSALALVLYAWSAISFVAISVALIASGVAFFVMWRWFVGRLQGFTGDCLGATQQVCELAFYLGLAVGWSPLS